MKVPYKWLKDYVDTDMSARELGDKMIMTGNGVEDIIDLGENLNKVVVGKILSLEKHPDADKLQICQIDVGSENLQIVTGADNVFEGALVPVALCGADLPNGMHIEKGKLRGIDSYGMLCSGGELCLKESDYPGAEVYGILILKGDLTPGMAMNKVLMSEGEVFDFEVGANRPDCLSVIGIAKETAATLNCPVKLPDASYTTAGGNVKDYIDAEVKDTDLCPRFMLRAVKNVKIGPSPDWMQERLKASGVRPINNIVDITNFIMLETGQPMHAYDAKDIRGNKIIVRRAEDGEVMRTLDGKEHEFKKSMLLICDQEGPIGIAGIMGGEESEIKPDTQTVIFEAAKFMYGNIRQTSRALGMATEASMRFSKGVDSANTEFALNRCCQLTQMLAAGEIVDGTVDILTDDLSDKILEVPVSYVNNRLGTTISADEMKNALERVFLKTEIINDGSLLKVLVPHIRGDIYGKADISEEIARMYGYDNLPERQAQGRPMTGGSKMDAFQDVLRDYMTAHGYNEAVTYSFTGTADLDKLELAEDSDLRRAVRIKNPLGDDTALMRTTLIADALKVVSMNLKRKNKAVRVFEINKVYLPESLPLTDKLPDERRQMVIAASSEDDDFFTLKSIVENVIALAKPKGNLKIEAKGREYFHPGRKAEYFLDGQLAAQLGEIHPDVQNNFEIGARVYVAQVDLETLLNAEKKETKFRALPKYPAIERDIAVVVEKNVAAGDIKDAILGNAGKYIENVELFDVYEGVNLLGKKSLAYSMMFRSPDGTLTDEDIAADMDHLLAELESQFGAKLRK